MPKQYSADVRLPGDLEYTGLARIAAVVIPAPWKFDVSLYSGESVVHEDDWLTALSLVSTHEVVRSVVMEVWKSPSYHALELQFSWVVMDQLPDRGEVLIRGDNETEVLGSAERLRRYFDRGEHRSPVEVEPDYRARVPDEAQPTTKYDDTATVAVESAPEPATYVSVQEVVGHGSSTPSPVSEESTTDSADVPSEKGWRPAFLRDVSVEVIGGLVVLALAGLAGLAWALIFR
jgi:hypothetical protein